MITKMGGKKTFASKKKPAKPHGEPHAWDYRIVRFVRKSKRRGDVVEYRICEVYFNDEGFVDLYCDAIPAGHNLKELATDVQCIREALSQPVLDEREFQSPPESEE